MAVTILSTNPVDGYVGYTPEDNITFEISYTQEAYPVGFHALQVSGSNSIFIWEGNEEIMDNFQIFWDGSEVNNQTFRCSKGQTGHTMTHTAGQTYTWSVIFRDNGSNVIWASPSFTYTAASPTAEKAYNPSPWHATSNDGVFDYKLSWSGGGNSFSIYIGSSSGSLSLADSGVTNNFYIVDSGDFPSDSIVYWRIDTVHDGGTITGDEWWFDPQVGTATNPTPSSGQGSVSVTQSRLYWDGGNLYQTFDVYIDAVLVESGTTNEYYDINGWASWPLSYETSYNWYVVSKNVHSEDTGATWSFTTGVETLPVGAGDDRPEDYAPDKVWDIGTDTWKSMGEIEVTGGGRYQSQIIIVGHNVIYFGDA